MLDGTGLTVVQRISGNMAGFIMPNRDVTVTANFVETGIVTMFEWDRRINPLSGIVGTSSPITPVAAYPNIRFSTRDSSNEAVAGNAVLNTVNGGIRVTGWPNLIIGATNDLRPTNPNLHIPGVLDLSDGTFRLTVNYEDPVLGIQKPAYDHFFRININNNTNRGENSLLGFLGVNEFQYTVETLISGTNNNQKFTTDVDVNTVILTFTTPDVFLPPYTSPLTTFPPPQEALDALSTSFIALTSPFEEFSGGGITITGIKLDRLP
jgi:hypothetical protein